MSLHKGPEGYWRIRISQNGRRIQESTRTKNKREAQQYHDQLVASLWKQDKLNELPNMSWKDAVIKWMKESQHKRSLKTDSYHFRWLDSHLGHILLKDIDKHIIENIAQERESASSPATVNRTLALIRAVLRKAEREWDWIHKAPFIRMRVENNMRKRWLSPEEVTRLLRECPPHLQDAIIFAIHTGLRESNISKLEWYQVDLERSFAYIPPEKSKTNKLIPVPLNSVALSVIKKQVGNHAKYVFTYGGKPVSKFNRSAWRKALKRAGIEDFHWHDLRHTWASWHVQNGTTEKELKELGCNLTDRYAHLAPVHLQNAANRITGLQPKERI